MIGTILSFVISIAVKGCYHYDLGGHLRRQRRRLRFPYYLIRRKSYAQDGVAREREQVAVGLPVIQKGN